MLRKLSLVYIVLQLLAFKASATSQPNILIMIGDDCTYLDLPIFGGETARTPHIDKLASEGIIFNRAFLSMAMCNPCRTELYTGLYPVSNGSAWNHSAARNGLKSMVHHLGDLGYRVGISGKVHVGPDEVFPFEKVRGLQGGNSRESEGIDTDALTAYMKQDPSQPFCLVLGFSSPHAPWTVEAPEHLASNKIQLPPNIANTEETRTAFSLYLSEIEELDRGVGLSLQALQASGQAANTLVLFTSEQGSMFPGGKWTNWNSGVHTAMVVRWPEVAAKGTRTDALIQYADVVPTLVEAAGGDWQSLEFDGSSFLPVIRGEENEHRAFAYCMHNNIPEGPPYPIRAVTNGTYLYIRNLRPDLLFIEKHIMGRHRFHDFWPSWLAESGPWNNPDREMNRQSVDLVHRYLRRPVEEFYKVSDDLYSMNNLADDPDYYSVKDVLSAELDTWMQSEGDPGALIDNEDDWRASLEGKHFQPITIR
ncbi:MAG: sulfatase [Verrucomicrobia bacterium]|nr:sulfatase [Verrucomicrobiota bacterium]MDA1068083.1 sulfatase [Verrucomicrobiota bacterium]